MNQKQKCQLEHLYSFEELTKFVEIWAQQRGLDNFTIQTALSQFAKTVEEVGELGVAISKGNDEAVKDAIGDIVVTLIIQAMLWGQDVTECLKAAWLEIKNRTGHMEGGIFVKD